MRTRKTVDLVTRIAEREWKWHQRHPNKPMPVIQDIRAEYALLARRVRKMKRTAVYNSEYDDVLELIKELKQ